MRMRMDWHHRTSEKRSVVVQNPKHYLIPLIYKNKQTVNLYVNSMWQLSFDVQTKTIANALELESDERMTKFRDSKYLTNFTFKDEANLNF